MFTSVRKKESKFPSLIQDEVQETQWWLQSRSSRIQEMDFLFLQHGLWFFIFLIHQVWHFTKRTTDFLFSECKTSPGSCVAVQQKPPLQKTQNSLRGKAQDRLLNWSKKKKRQIFGQNFLMGCLHVHATLRVDRIQGSASRELNTWAKHWWKRAVRTGKLPKLPNLIIPRLIREGLSCLSPSSGQHLLSLTHTHTMH